MKADFWNYFFKIKSIKKERQLPYYELLWRIVAKFKASLLFQFLKFKIWCLRLSSSNCWSRAIDNNCTDFTSDITGGFCNSLWFSCRMAVFISSFSVVWTCNSSRNLAFSSSRYWARNSIWNHKNKFMRIYWQFWV